MPDEPSRRMGLNRASRLQDRRDFTRLRKEGKRLVKGCLIANWRRLEPGACSQVGVVTSRQLGKAVVRNRARRLLRESFRLHRHRLSEPVALVLVARSSIVGKKRAEVERDFLAVLHQAQLLSKS